MTTRPLRPSAQMLTPREISRLLRLSPMTVYRLIQGGDLRAYRFGRQLRVRRDDFEAFMGSAQATGGDDL